MNAADRPDRGKGIVEDLLPGAVPDGKIYIGVRRGFVAEPAIVM